MWNLRRACSGEGGVPRGWARTEHTEWRKTLAETFDIAETKCEFERDGCAIIRGCLTRAELDELTERTEIYLGRRDLGFRDRSRPFAGTLKNLNVDDPWFSDQLHHGKPARIVGALLDDSLDPATAALFDRIPGEKRGIDPHFDAIGHRRRGATLWIALDKADTGNGCLRYARGSHRLRFESKVGLDGFDDDTDGVLKVELEPGDAAVHSSLLVHWSTPNTSGRSRRGISFFYWAASSTAHDAH